MNPLVKQLIDCLAGPTSDEEIERCGFLLSMLVEKHSKQKTPGAFYQEVLPEPLVDVELNESAYRQTVSKLCDLLGSPVTRIKSKEMILFALAGTDSRTLVPCIPALVQFLRESVGEPIFEDGAKCLMRMLSSPQKVQEQSAQIRRALPDLEDLLKVVNDQTGHTSDATLALVKLRNLLTR